MTNCERVIRLMALGEEAAAEELSFLREHLTLCETCRLAASEVHSLLLAAQEAAFTPDANLTRDLRERILSKLPVKTPSPWWVFQPGWAMAFLVLLAFGVFWHRGTRPERELPWRADVATPHLLGRTPPLPQGEREKYSFYVKMEIVEKMDLFTEMEILENLEALEKT